MQRIPRRSSAHAGGYEVIIMQKELGWGAIVVVKIKRRDVTWKKANQFILYIDISEITVGNRRYHLLLHNGEVTVFVLTCCRHLLRIVAVSKQTLL